MDTSEQHKATQGSCLLDLFLRPVVGVLGCWQSGRGGKWKIESLQIINNWGWHLCFPWQAISHAAKVGRFLGMVMNDNEFETKENKI